MKDRNNIKTLNTSKYSHMLSKMIDEKNAKAKEKQKLDELDKRYKEERRRIKREKKEWRKNEKKRKKEKKTYNKKTQELLEKYEQEWEHEGERLLHLSRELYNTGGSQAIREELQQVSSNEKAKFKLIKDITLGMIDIDNIKPNEDLDKDLEDFDNIL